MNGSLYAEIHHICAMIALGYCRLAPVFFLLPYLNGGYLSATVRTPIIALITINIMPYQAIDFSQVYLNDLLAIIVKEALIGLLLGCMLASPVWIFSAIGSFIDNQRGATLSGTLDPSTGVDRSELANFFSLMASVIFLCSGGMTVLLEVLHKSYQLWNPYQGELPDLRKMAEYLNYMVLEAVRLSSPAIAVMLGAEVFLGILSRYAAQLNAFSISLTIKSLLAFLILLIYFYPVLTERVPTLSFTADALMLFSR